MEVRREAEVEVEASPGGAGKTGAAGAAAGGAGEQLCQTSLARGNTRKGALPAASQRSTRAEGCGIGSFWRLPLVRLRTIGIRQAAGHRPRLDDVLRGACEALCCEIMPACTPYDFTSLMHHVLLPDPSILAGVSIRV